jgi:hypothetical protein
MVVVLDRRRRPPLAALGAIVGVTALFAVTACDALRPRSGLEQLATMELSTEVMPWYLMHGLLISGRAMTIRDATSGATLNAVDYLTTEHDLKDRHGQVIQSLTLDAGLPRFADTYGQSVCQGHPNQFLAMLTWVDVPVSQPLRLQAGGDFTLADVLENAKRNIRPSQILAVPPKTKYEDHELGWSISVFAEMLGTDAQWTNRWGEQVSVEELVGIAIERPTGWGSCGGTHEMFGLARALRARQAQHRELSGVWKKLDDYVEAAKARARAAQHADGSFDYGWGRAEPQHPTGNLPPSRKVHITGHMLEWLVLASSPEEMADSHLRKAYDFLGSCRFREIALAPGRRGEHIVSYGGLSHAVRGMRRYRERLAEQTAHRPGATESAQ